jgi:arginine decarboxylase-like protein
VRSLTTKELSEKLYISYFYSGCLYWGLGQALPALPLREINKLLAKVLMQGFLTTDGHR